MLFSFKNFETKSRTSSFDRLKPILHEIPTTSTDVFPRLSSDLFSYRTSMINQFPFHIILIDSRSFPSDMLRSAIWYYLYNLKNAKNTHGRVLILVKLQAEAGNFTKINLPPWVFFTFFKLCK